MKFTSKSKSKWNRSKISKPTYVNSEFCRGILTPKRRFSFFCGTVSCLEFTCAIFHHRCGIFYPRHTHLRTTPRCRFIYWAHCYKFCGIPFVCGKERITRRCSWSWAQQLGKVGNKITIVLCTIETRLHQDVDGIMISFALQYREETAQRNW